MAYEQVRDVLDRIGRFHHLISEFYEQLEGIVEKERVVIILDYLRRHEILFEERIKEFERQADANTLDTWFKYTPTDDMQREIARLEARPDLTTDEVVSMALRLDDIMLNIYRESCDFAVIDEVKEVFSNLYDECVKERSKMVLAVFGYD